jgi:hypothetical protein
MVKIINCLLFSIMDFIEKIKKNMKKNEAMIPIISKKNVFLFMDFVIVVKKYLSLLLSIF